MLVNVPMLNNIFSCILHICPSYSIFDNIANVIVIAHPLLLIAVFGITVFLGDT
jgi:hypothetical protein